MSFKENLKKDIKFARTEGKVLVKVVSETDAEYANLEKGWEEGTIPYFLADEGEVKFRLSVVNNVEILGTTKSEKDGKTYQRVYLIGRDTLTNQTLRTWTIVEEGKKMYQEGDLAEFPCVHVPHGSWCITMDASENVTAITATKPEGAYQHTSQKLAERLNETRVLGYQMSATTTVKGSRATADAKA